MQPVVTMVVFTIILSKGAHLAGRHSRIRSSRTPVSCRGSSCPQGSPRRRRASSTTGARDEGLLPTSLIPIGPVLSGLVDFFVGLFVLVALMIYYHVSVTWTCFSPPSSSCLPGRRSDLGDLAVGAERALPRRAVRGPVPGAASVLHLAGRVLDDRSSRRGSARIGINPMAGVVNGFRWALLGISRAGRQLMLLVARYTVILLLGGLAFFRRVERSFADVV